MLTLSIIGNIVLLAILLYVQYRKRVLRLRLVHMCTQYETLWLQHHKVKDENARHNANRLELRYKLAELRRDAALILGDVAPAGDDLRNNTNLPPLQPMPTPPECRMVKESFKE